MYASAAAVRRDLAPMMRPADRILPVDACEDEVWIATPGGYNGPFVCPPYMRRPLNLIASREFQGIGFLGPAQSGKTVSLVECVAAYVVNHVRADMILGQTTQSVARDYSDGVLKRLYRYSKGMQQQLVVDNTHKKEHRSGNSMFVVWPSVNQMSGKTVQYFVQTDIDRQPTNVDGEGSTWTYGWNRIKTFMSRGKNIAESSPGGEVIDPSYTPKHPHEMSPAEGITSIYNSGTQEQWYWPCPECGEYFHCRATFDESYLFIPDCGADLMAAAEQSMLICPNNGCMVNLHKHRKEMNEHGVWVGRGQTVNSKGELQGDRIAINIATFGLAGYAAQFQKPKDLVLQYLQARKTYEDTGSEIELMGVHNTQLGACYSPLRNYDRNSVHELQARADTYKKGTVPSQVRFLVAAVDVQKGRFVVQVHGIGEGLEEWVIDRFNIRYSQRYDEKAADYNKINPALYAEDWDLIESAVMDKEYPLEDDPETKLPIVLTGCDSGGEPGVTSNAYAFAALMHSKGRSHQFALVKGASNPQSGRVKVTYPEKAVINGVKHRLYLLCPLQLKDSVAASLERDKPGPRYLHFPCDLGSWFYAELTSEDRTSRGWIKPGRANNEGFDLAYYIRGLSIELGVERPDFWENPPEFAALRKTEKPKNFADKMAELGQKLNG